jgi:DNA (cytosine-5)-methyltransferase 1
MARLTAIDLFAGIGGIRLGLEQAGFDVIYSNDCDKFCKITFESNFNDKLDTRKIEDVPLSDIPDNIDLLTGGFPCQPFSLAGLRRGFDDPRGSLFSIVANIIKEKRPGAFLLENVKNLKRHDGGNTLRFIINTLRDDLGYFVPDPVILNSKFFGVPQGRERIYIVGFRNRVDFEFPVGSTRIPKLIDTLEEGVDDEFYFLSQKYLDCLIEHKNRHKEKGHGFGLEILEPEGISNTLVVGNMGRERNLVRDLRSKIAYSKNDQGVRKLTIRECARLQGFPDNFSFEPVSRTQAYKQLGNSVSVPVIKAIAMNIILALNAKRRNAIDIINRKEVNLPQEIL